VRVTTEALQLSRVLLEELDEPCLEGFQSALASSVEAFFYVSVRLLFKVFTQVSSSFNLWPN